MKDSTTVQNVTREGTCKASVAEPAFITGARAAPKQIDPSLAPAPARLKFSVVKKNCMDYFLHDNCELNLKCLNTKL